MLNTALQFLADVLNAYLVSRAGVDDKVTLSKIIDEAGKYPFGEGMIAASLINVEEERVLKSQLPDYVYVGGQHVVREPDLKLNLLVMFAANFKAHDEALKFISHILLYFQTQPTFTQEEFPALDPRIERLTLELQSPTFDQLNQIWTYLGGKYLPSVIYKVRMVVLEPEVAAAIQPPISKIQTAVHN